MGCFYNYVNRSIKKMDNLWRRYQSIGPILYVNKLMKYNKVYFIFKNIWIKIGYDWLINLEGGEVTTIF